METVVNGCARAKKPGVGEEYTGRSRWLKCRGLRE